MSMEAGSCSSPAGMDSRGTRVNALIGTGHFLSHFYVLCLPPMFLVLAERVRGQLTPSLA